MTAQSVRLIPASTSSRLRAGKGSLLWSCAGAAIAAVAIHPQAAKAQAAPQGAFQGSIIGDPANVSRGSLTATTETITITAPKATIDWSASQADFLPSGNVATFLGSGVADFTVLNRINADGQRIELNGTVLGRLQGQGSTPGGKIWFYSPGGILVGGAAVFDVGGLVLTANDPVSFGDSTDGFGQFTADIESNASVVISAGAKIDALAQNSYVALIAPRVEQHGTVNVDGSAAYVAAQQLTMTFNQGLFDVALQVGTGDSTGIIHSGTTGGPASTGAGDNHRVTMVAVPKNQAMTMLLSGNVGFAPATVAGVKNGTIVLSAGWSIDDSAGGASGSVPPGTDAGMILGAGNYTSDVDGRATGDILASADQGSIDFAGNLTLRSYSGVSTSNVQLLASDENLLKVGGNLLLANGNTTYPSVLEITAYTDGAVDILGTADLYAGSAGPADPGAINLSASQNGSVTIGGSTLLVTSAGAASINPDTASTDNYGGEVEVSAGSGGSISVRNLTIQASANGQDNDGNGSGADLGVAGDAHGGDVSIDAWWDGTITIDGNLYVNVDGYGGNMLAGGLVGGTGYGGSAVVNGSNGELSITGNAFLTALGIGGDYLGGGTPGVAQGGYGEGGTANIWMGGPGSLNIDGATTLRADGSGGDGQVGGEGLGGNAGITGYDGDITLGSVVDISARGTGGNANAGYGGAGGVGRGGTAYIEAFANPGNVEQDPTSATITAPVIGTVTLDVTGTGGSGGAGNGDNIVAGAGGAGYGGLYTGSIGSGGAFALADSFGAMLTLGALNMHAAGVGGAGGVGGTDQQGGLGGTGTGGFTQAGTFNPNELEIAAAVVAFGNVYMDSGAVGGAGGAGNNGAAAGAGGYASAGGNTECGDGFFCGGNVFNARGSVTTGLLTLSSVATGGAGSVGGNALGGYGWVSSVVGGSLTVGAALNINTSATGGAGITTGGNATGGYSTINSDGAIGVTNGIILAAFGHGGAGTGASSTGGNGSGGESLINVTSDATLTAGGIVNYNTAGRGGNAVTLGGIGQGGDSLMTIDGGSITVGTLWQYANGFGGTGATGGDATGGRSATSYSENGGSFYANNTVRMEAQGLAGAGTTGNGGNGTGGETDLNISSDATYRANVLINFADGVGGVSTSGAGGSGTGGESILTIDSGSLTAELQGFVTADGFGGTGASGGNGLGGTATVNMTSNGGSLTGAYFETHAWGHGGDSSGAGPAGSGTGATTNFEVADVLNEGATATISLNNLYAFSNGDGGAVVGTGTGAGGAGTGGSVIVDLGAATTTIAQLAMVYSQGNGGDGVSSGGEGQGGTAQLIVRSGPTTALDVEVNADGFGGHASNGTGGNGTAGLASLGASGNLTANGETWVSADAEGGDGTTAGDGHGGSATLAAYSGGSLDLASANVRADGEKGVGIGGAGTGGSANVDIENGSLITDALMVDAGGSTTGGTAAIDVGYASDGVMIGNLTAYALTASADGAQDAGEVSFNVAAESTAFIGAATFSAIGADPEAGGVSIFVGSGFSYSEGEITTGLIADSLTLNATGPIYIELANGALFDVIGTFTANSDGAIDLVDGGSAAAIVANEIDFDAAAINAGVTLFAGNISLTVGGDIDVGSLVATQLLEIYAGGTINAGDLEMPGSLSWTGANINAGDLTSLGGLALNASSGIYAGALTGNSVSVQGGNYLSVGNVSATTTADLWSLGSFGVYDVTAGDEATFSSGATVQFYGQVSAPEITVTSRDIYVADEASLGDHGVTQLLTLNAVSDSAVIIGEYDIFSEGIQYRLDEDGDIQSHTVVINAVGLGEGGDPDIHIYDVEIDGSNTDDENGGVSHVSVNTGGSVQVNGLVLYSGAGATDLLEINAGETIQVNTSNGGRIAMIDNSEEPSGMLELTADNIWVGDQALLDSLAENPDFTGRDEALATNNGENNPEGNLIAGGMRLGISETLFVQNSGTDSDFAGITVGNDGLHLAATGEDLATFVAYGQRRNADGSFTGGEEFVGEIEFSTEVGLGFSDTSSFNGCAFGSDCGGNPGPGGPIGGPESILGPVGLMNSPMSGAVDEDERVILAGILADGGESGSSDGEDEESEEESAASIAASLGLISTGGLTTEQLIDDPVTSGSDSGQWDGDNDINPGE